MLFVIAFISPVSVWAEEVPVEVVEDNENSNVPQEEETIHDLDDLYSIVDLGVYTLWFGFGSISGILVMRQFLP